MWLHGMNKTASLNHGEGQNKNVIEVTAGMLSMRNKTRFSCKYCLMFRPFPQTLSYLHRAGLTPFNTEVFRCGKPPPLLPSSLKIYDVLYISITK